MLTPSDKSFYQQAGQKLTNHAKNSLIKASHLARSFDSKEITMGHFLFAIFLEKGSLGSTILKDLGIKEKNFSAYLHNSQKTPENTKVSALPSLSQDVKKIFTKAYAVAKDFGYPYVGTEHLVYAIFESDSAEISKLASDLNFKNIEKSLQALFDPGQIAGLSKMLNLPEIKLAKPHSKKSSATPFVDKFCINLNHSQKKKNEILVGRETEIQRVINILGRKNKNNPLLIGEPGTGKTAMIMGLAEKINLGEVPNSLYRKRIMGLDIAQLIAGTSFRGEFESRLKEILKEVAENKNIILFIDEIHNIVGAGNVAGSLDLANIIKPALTQGEIQIIGATTLTEYKKFIEKDAALERRFQPVQISEPSEKEAEKILLGIKSHYENFHNVVISNSAITLAVNLSTRYIQNRFLPDKAIDVLDETAANIRSKNKVSDFLQEIRKLEQEKIELLEEKEKLVTQENFEKAITLRSKEKELEEKIAHLQQKQTENEKENRVHIQEADILETISKISSIPLEKLSQEKTQKIKNIEKILDRQIIGQKEAVQKIAGVLLRSQSGISNPDRPLGSFLFLGPTGVGKTLTAKILAQEFFGSPSGKNKPLIRIDMSELMERHSVSSLIGSPAGYIGYGEGGNLTEKIRRNPYSVVLFDEIEKAHPDVFNILLQILEDGTLTDAEGTTVSFKNTIIILTSNIGTDEFTNASRVGFESQDEKRDISQKFNAIKEQTVKELEKKLRPELINRLDYVLVFNALGEKEIRDIVRQEIAKLQKRLSEQNIKFSASKEIILFVTQKSLAFNQGARLVRKNIQEMLENPIAEMIVYAKVRGQKIGAKLEKETIKLF